jgi:hypothetical protein
MRLTEPALEERQEEALTTLLGKADCAFHPGNTLSYTPGAHVSQSQQAAGGGPPVEELRRLADLDGSREWHERLRKLPAVEVDISDRRISSRETGHVVRREGDVQGLSGHRQCLGELPQLRESPNEPVTRQHRRDP